MSDLAPSVLPLDKGLDLQTAKIIAPPGSVLDSLNYEQVDFQGQKRIEGYARYDGTALSALDEYYIVQSDDIPAEAAAGDVLLKEGKPFGVIGLTEDGAIYYTKIDDTVDVVAGDTLTVTHRLPAGDEEFTMTVISYATGRESATDSQAHYDKLLEVSTAVRQVVEHLPGAIAGLHWFKDRLYAVASLQAFASAPRLTGRLPDYVCGDEVDYSYIAYGGVPPITFSISEGALPLGLTMSTDGVVSGEMALGGDATWTVKITDSLGATAEVEENRTGMNGFFTYLTSKPYTIIQPPDSLTSALVFDGPYYPPSTVAQDPMTSSMTVTGGSLRDLVVPQVQTPESMTSSAVLTGGVLTPLLKQYVTPVENLTSGAVLTGGTLAVKLVPTTMQPENITSAALLTGGTLA